MQGVVPSAFWQHVFRTCTCARCPSCCHDRADCVVDPGPRGTSCGSRGAPPSVFCLACCPAAVLLSGEAAQPRPVAAACYPMPQLSRPGPGPTLVVCARAATYQ
jgi:hypothetical protein